LFKAELISKFCDILVIFLGNKRPILVQGRINQ